MKTCRYQRSTIKPINDTARPSPTSLVFTQERSQCGALTHALQQGSHLNVHYKYQAPVIKNCQSSAIYIFCLVLAHNYTEQL
jgi:hypothetical protein